MKTFLTYVDENSFGPALDKMYPMGDLNAADEKEVKKSDLDQIEKYADKIFALYLFINFHILSAPGIQGKVCQKSFLPVIAAHRSSFGVLSNLLPVSVSYAPIKSQRT